MHYFDGIQTPIGRLHLVASDKAVVRIFFPHKKWKERFIRSPKHPLIMRLKKELREYFAGERRKFTVPLSMEGTAFQKEAWGVLRKIPYGTTLSYAEEAKRMGRKRAVRAVGSANGKNPLPIVVPCHRVVASGGGSGGGLRRRNPTWIFMGAPLPKDLGGYAGGLAMKKKLLALERRNFARRK